MTQIDKLLLVKRILGLLVLLVLLACFVAVNVPALAAPQAQLTPFPTPTPGADGRILYIVQPADTLWRIAAITGVPLESLRALNDLGLDDVIAPGDVLLIGIAGPVAVTPTAGPSPTPAPAQPTPTQPLGAANLCVLLYNDLNGDSLWQETEPVIPGGAISVSNFSGSVSLTSDTSVPVEAQCLDAYDEPTTFVLFTDLREGEYNVSVAIPEGYNATTDLNGSLQLYGGDETYMSFGAQANSEKAAEPVLIPEGGESSPLLAVIGGLLLAVGVGVGVYAWVLARK